KCHRASWHRRSGYSLPAEAVYARSTGPQGAGGDRRQRIGALPRQSKAPAETGAFVFVGYRQARNVSADAEPPQEMRRRVPAALRSDIETLDHLLSIG